MVLIPRDGKSIYAHEEVLAAGCKYLRDGLSICVNPSLNGLVRYYAIWRLFSCLLNCSQAGTIKFLGRVISQASFESAIKHMYGFEFNGVGGKWPHSLIELSEVALIASDLRITGLYELVCEIADRAMIESLGNEAKLKMLMCAGGRFAGEYCKIEPVFHPLAIRLIGENFFERHKSEVFHEVLGWRPELERDLLSFLGDHLDPSKEEEE